MIKWTAFTIGIILVVTFIITMFALPPLLGWHYPVIEDWQDFVDSINTVEGFLIGIIMVVVLVICITIGAIYLIVFLVKLLRGKE